MYKDYKKKEFDMTDIYSNTENNNIIDNFLPDNIYSDITHYIDDQLIKKEWVSTHKNQLIKRSNDQNKVTINTDLGRIRLEVRPEPKLLKYIENYVQQYKKNIMFQHAYFVEYNKKYGIPNLPPHADATDSGITIVYQLKSNIVWKSMVEGKEIELKDNQGFWINVRDQAHWRRPHVFNDGDFLQMVFFHFHDPDNLFEMPDPQFLATKSRPWLLKEMENGYFYS